MEDNSWYKKSLRKTVKLAGLDKIGVIFHSLRHTWATNNLAGGADTRTLQKLGGWSSLKMVERYTHPHDKAMRQAVNRAARVGKPRNRT